MNKLNQVQTKDILLKIQDVCSDLAGVEPIDVAPSTYLIEDLGFSPADLSQLFSELEEEYQLVFSAADLDRARQEDMTVIELIHRVEDSF